MTWELVQEVRRQIYDLSVGNCKSVEDFYRMKGRNEAYAQILRWMNTMEAESSGHIQETGDENA